MDDKWRSRIVGHAEVPPETLVANEKNWRAHPRAQRRALAGVLDQIGWVGEVIVNRHTNRIVDGHLRVELAVRRRESTVPVTFVDLSQEEEALVLATFDPLGAAAETDGEALRSLLSTVDAGDTAVRELLSRLSEQVVDQEEGPRQAVEPDAVPTPAAVPVSRVGDLWTLGRGHRVLCGDATLQEDVRRVMGGAVARWLWGDPPYGVGYVGRTAEAMSLRNDSPEELEVMLPAAFNAVDFVLAPGAPIYIASPSGLQSVTFGRAFVEVPWHLHQTLVWVKDAPVIGHSDFQYQHELILYGWKPGRRPWFGGRATSTVFAIPRPRRNAEHPTQKPVELVEAQLRCSARSGDHGIDPFLGSATTLVAAERLGLVCHGIELDPRFVDVAIERWQALTGEQATLDDGMTFAAAREARRGR